MQDTDKKIKLIFFEKFGKNIDSVEKLPESGSARKYFRLKSENLSVIAVYNKDIKENTAFLEFSKTFKNNGIKVPEVYAVNTEKDVYLIEDLGNTTLYDKIKQTGFISEEIKGIYKKALEQLAELQIVAGKEIDYSLCYPRDAFDRQSVMWDLNYFKYNFLKFTDILFDEQLLEDDFNTLSEYLLKAETSYFLYRDFQSRNIMLKDKQVYFIDYQGGRKGALQYDIASLLYDAKAGISAETRKELLNYYINCVKEIRDIDKDEFKEYFYAYALIRILQAFGAYGYRGIFEKKRHFIESIPYGLKNIAEILPDVKIIDKMPELKRVLEALPSSEKLKNINSENKLTVNIKSFSYKRGIPYDNTGNGGGFVFDCRFINNPGRIEKYKKLCGKDEEVAEFLEKEDDTHIFLSSIKNILSSAVKNYTSRNFENLAVNFGCTGGQHRSVYFAEKISEFLKETFDVNVNLIHTEGF